MTSNTPVLRTIGIRDVVFGEDVLVIDPVNLYECTIGDHSFIGPFVEIQKGARIGRHCRIQSHAFICELVEIGDHCFISHGAMFINDTLARGHPEKERAFWKPTVVGDHVSIGTNATILPVKIADHVVIGAGSVVTKDILGPGIYAGNPAKKLRDLPAK